MANCDINIGIDVDGTLTKGKINQDVMALSQSEVEKMMLELAPKDGIDILLENDHNKLLITGRPETYRVVTADWLEMYGIPYHELIMFPNDYYVSNGYSLSKYIELKLDIHIKKNVSHALDDDINVVNSLNSIGIPAYKVDDNFKVAFEKILESINNIKDANTTKTI